VDAQGPAFLARLLVSSAADVNARNHNGQTALLIAAASQARALAARRTD
jgi:ankyrin repeat protein